MVTNITCRPKFFLILKLCLNPQLNKVPHSASILRSRYTSGRTALAPYGHRGYRFVEIGNVLSSRTALMILVATWRGLIWLLEQPSGSFLKDLPRFQWLWDLLQARSTWPKKTTLILGHVKFNCTCSYLVTLQVYTTTIHMGVFGSGSPKPHQLHSNDCGLLEALSNEVGYMSKEDRDKCTVKTTRRYVDSNGKRRCVGIPSALKESAYLVMNILSAIYLFYLFPNSRHALLCDINTATLCVILPQVRHYPARFGEFIAQQAVQRRDVPTLCKSYNQNFGLFPYLIQKTYTATTGFSWFHVMACNNPPAVKLRCPYPVCDCIECAFPSMVTSPISSYSGSTASPWTTFGPMFLGGVTHWWNSTIPYVRLYLS